MNPSNHHPYQPVWQKTGKLKVGNYWESYSLKARASATEAGRVVRFYSKIEYHHWIKLESDPNIVQLCEQPLYVKAEVEGREVSSRPDMWYLTRDRDQYICEVKYRRDLAHPKRGPRALRQIAAQKKWAEQNGHRHSLAIDSEIYEFPALITNWVAILHCLAVYREPPADDLIDRVVHVVTLRPGTTLGQLAQAFNTTDAGVVQAAAFHALHQGLLHAPLKDTTLNLTTPFYHE